MITQQVAANVRSDLHGFQEIRVVVTQALYVSLVIIGIILNNNVLPVWQIANNAIVK